MNFSHVPNTGYVPTYTRNDFTDALHESFDFRTNYEIKVLERVIYETFY